MTHLFKMNPAKQQLNAVRFFQLLSALVILVCLNSCARKISFQNSAVVPAATGKVKVKRDNNNNYNISLNLVNLAPADKLTPPRNTYVVWMVNDQNSTSNIGLLNSSSGFLSDKLKASLNATSPLKPVRIFLTAENDGTVQYPMGEQIISTSNF